MSEPVHADEIAERVRRLIASLGNPVLGGVQTSYQGRDYMVGRYYMRVKTGGELYVNVRDAKSFYKRIFRYEYHHGHLYPWKASCYSAAECNKLLLFLREHMILQDLADA